MHFQVICGMSLKGNRFVLVRYRGHQLQANIAESPWCDIDWNHSNWKSSCSHQIVPTRQGSHLKFYVWLPECRNVDFAKLQVSSRSVAEMPISTRGRSWQWTAQNACTTYIEQIRKRTHSGDMKICCWDVQPPKAGHFVRLSAGSYHIFMSWLQTQTILIQLNWFYCTWHDMHLGMIHIRNFPIQT